MVADFFFEKVPNNQAKYTACFEVHIEKKASLQMHTTSDQCLCAHRQYTLSASQIALGCFEDGKHCDLQATQLRTANKYHIISTFFTITNTLLKKKNNKTILS